MARRYYSSTAARTTLASGVDNSTTTLSVVAVSGWPSSYPYTLVIDQDTVNEELVSVTNRSGTTLTVTRGIDGTSAVAHDAGAAVNHGVSAQDFDEPNAFINGTGVVTETLLATDSVSAVKIVDGTITNAKIGASADIAQSKIANLTSDLAEKLPYAYGTATPSTTDSGFLWYDSNSTPAAPKFWNGSAFVNFPSGLALVTTDTFSAVSSVSIDNCFTSAYENYKIMFVYTLSSSGGASFRFRASGTDNTASNYNRVTLAGFSTSTAVSSSAGASSLAFPVDSGEADARSVITYDVYSPQLAEQTVGTYVANRGSQSVVDVVTAGHTSSSAFDGFSIFRGSGTMTGRVYVYGYRD